MIFFFRDLNKYAAVYLHAPVGLVLTKQNLTLDLFSNEDIFLAIKKTVVKKNFFFTFALRPGHIPERTPYSCWN